jgi:hypothetical protein
MPSGPYLANTVAEDGDGVSAKAEAALSHTLVVPRQPQVAGAQCFTDSIRLLAKQSDLHEKNI